MPDWGWGSFCETTTTTTGGDDKLAWTSDVTSVLGVYNQSRLNNLSRSSSFSLNYMYEK